MPNNRGDNNAPPREGAIAIDIGSNGKDKDTMSGLALKTDEQDNGNDLGDLDKFDNDHEDNGKVCTSTGLTEDVYSLLTVTPWCSLSFFYCLVVILMQWMTIVVTLLDLLGTSSPFGGGFHPDSTNPLQVPAGVSKEVSVACGICMLLMVATQTNFLTALDKITTTCYATSAKLPLKSWFAVMLQLLVGLAMFVLGFVLNIQATTALTVMLNFAALHFINEIQDIFFWVAKHGYVSSNVQKATKKVLKQMELEEEEELKTAISIRASQPAISTSGCQWLVPHIKRIIYFLATLGIMIGYGVIIVQQQRGDFLCQNVFFQFGDDFRPELPSYSGEYGKHPTQKMGGGRAVYYNEVSGARFSYCESLGAWTFKGGKFDLFFGEGEDSEIVRVNPETDDPCQDYWLKSQETDTFDVTETTAWFIWDMYTNQTNIPVDFIAYQCLNCDFNGGRTCSNAGTCNTETNHCDCEFGRFGLDCEYAMPCGSMELDQRTSPFPPVLNKNGEGRSLPASSYEILTDDEGIPVILYDKPVYVSYFVINAEDELASVNDTETISLLTAMIDQADPMVEDILMFLGRRWGVAQSINEDGTSTNPTKRSALIDYLRGGRFQAVFSGYDFHMMSSPADFGTPSYRVTPANFVWFKTKKWLTLAGTESTDSNGDLEEQLDLYRADETQPIETVLLCKYCQSALNPCMNTGYCAGQDNTPHVNDGLGDGAGGSCQCLFGFSGHLCEREQACTDTNATCLHDATCNADTGNCNCSSQYEGRLCQYDALRRPHTEF